ncbi:MAG: electron transport complex subunit E [Oscillospiraceae bacterium]
MNQNFRTLISGIIKENPVLVLLLGTCPALGVTTSAINGLGMGVAATLVLLGSNVVISLTKNIISDKVRIPAYIVIIAGFVTVIQLLIKAYARDIDASLGIFLPLIVVNCIILGRAEMFASKNTVFASFCDAIGMGLGFTLALFLMGSIRELLGNGSWFGITLLSENATMAIFMLAPGGFFVYGVLIAAVNKITKGRAIKKKEFGCSGCPSSGACATTNSNEGV